LLDIAIVRSAMSEVYQRQHGSTTPSEALR
jgi:hypothetical protein